MQIYIKFFISPQIIINKIKHPYLALRFQNSEVRILSFLLSFLSLVLLFSLNSCRKPIKFSSENLTFSVDTLVFDTVFTTVGSTTQSFKFYNPSNSPIKIDEIELVGGSSSPFRINVDGVKGPKVGETEMEGKDSLFVFVEVTLAVNNGTLPMVVEDRIRFRTNGKDQYVQLAVWGQDAYFHRNDINSGTWPNDKPHVIYGYAGIDSAETLNIIAGTHIFLHKNSLIYNYKGTLNILGTKDNKVTMQGDRLESFYDDVQGQYYGIYMQEARPSVIEHLEQKNGIAGLHLFSRDPNFTDYTVTIRHSEFYNNSRYGLFVYSGARLKAENSISHSNALHALLLLEGGGVHFNYCNLLSYGATGQTPAVGLSNYFFNQATGDLNIGEITESTFTNSIIYGAQATELVLDTLDFQGQKLWTFDFDNCVISKEANITGDYYKNMIWNNDPLFSDPFSRNFNVLSNSPILNSANQLYYLPIDFKETTRDAAASDIGFLEFP